MKLQVYCVNLPQTYWVDVTAPKRAGGGTGIPRHSEAFRGGPAGPPRPRRISAHEATPTTGRKAIGSRTALTLWTAGLPAGPKSFEGPRTNSEAFRGRPPKRAREAPGGQIYQKFSSESRKPQNCKPAPALLKKLEKAPNHPKSQKTPPIAPTAN